MWSGVPMTTASMFFPSLSSIWRKSLYFAALSHRWNPGSPRAQSTSASATMFSVSHWRRSPNGWPPAPMPAMFSFSLGDW